MKYNVCKMNKKLNLPFHFVGGGYVITDTMKGRFKIKLKGYIFDYFIPLRNRFYKINIHKNAL